MDDTIRRDAVPEDGVAAALAKRISSARIRTEPFPYVVVNDFLPPALYREGLAHWPSDDRFKTTNYARRYQLNLTAYTSGQFAEEAFFWRSVLDLAAQINRALFEKLRPYFQLKFRSLLGENWKATIAGKYHVSFREAHLAQYSGSSGLHPHVDSQRLVLNSFLYMSETDEIEPSLGTVLYRTYGFSMPENNMKLAAKTQDRFLARDVVIPYRRNCLFSFLNTPFAFHGVDEFDIGERRRRIMLLGPVIRESEIALHNEFKRRGHVIDWGDDAAE